MTNTQPINLPLEGKAVLIVEDDYFQADDARAAMEAAGAKVIGPFPDSLRGLKALREDRPDCALLDINLGAGAMFDMAEAATALGVPFVFMTGYDGKQIALPFTHIERLQKPANEKAIVAALLRACRV
jgi:DNA-binding LytR/AlgR family response regulator